MGNSLQAVLDRAKAQTPEPSPAAKIKPEPPKRAKAPKVEPKADSKAGRTNTVLIGGHFPPEVLKQLRIIAAEEETTNQALLEQALDLLFVKKGKRRIGDL